MRVSLIIGAVILIGGTSGCHAASDVVGTGCGSDPSQGAAMEDQPTLSPSGEYLAYYGGGGPFIRLLDINQGLTRTLGPGTGPEFSWDGRTLAYATTSGIALYDLATGESAPLSTQFQVFSLAWEPGDSSLVYDANLNGAWRIRIHGGPEAQVLPSGSRSPSISPDGRYIACNRVVPGTHRGQIYVYDGVSNSTRRLTYDDAEDRGASWSPDAESLVCARVLGRGLLDSALGLFVVNVKSGSERRIALPSDACTTIVTSPEWSRDGSLIVFSAYTDKRRAWTIWVVGPDGANPHPITDGN